MVEHFTGKYEVELKFRIDDIAVFRNTLFSLHPEAFVFENKEHDVYYDDAENRLQQQHIKMLVRRMEPSGIKLWIVKGPGADRCEAVNVEAFEKTDSMLQTLGYKPLFEIHKIRSIYFLNSFHITLDYIESLGYFVEISVMTDDETQLKALRDRCIECALRLQLSLDHIETKSYYQLLGFN
ncbi:adenylate cyclase [Pectobacterium actinidiae]|uniref:Adenylate cyclase n=1 Tax=Pectobacterium actinidiae TaxID=1507808 RepID=A0A1V2R5S1_9GAMM|nr:class IV adenylate cyclase [Pectobacterium actinidiae]QDX97921.1 class IV adenylate cyclase [Pectobacterium carotovorum subsp. carotovorum]KHN91462.1 adenylate cyclase [Pectobacterium actinidiae]MDY4315987.1 class IV adenylate cyclase [Pectobacterium actinidiae]ONK04883.1 adenylate cyclase [Pectobacterium actinidiae]ONK07506.1 adenylate cyclase [Pectobacterium actinidiae]